MGRASILYSQRTADVMCSGVAIRNTPHVRQSPVNISVLSGVAQVRNVFYHRRPALTQTTEQVTVAQFLPSGKLEDMV